MTDTTREAVERLTGPDAEAMPDGERLTALVQMCRALSAEVERLTSHHYTGSRVEDAIAAHWGSRCYDFAEGCSCCEAWAEYDRLTAAAQTAPEDVGALVADAMAEATKAMRKFPQPNYVISKVAEEAGEVVKAAIHCAEGRERPEAVRGEIVQCMAMLIRLFLEGDQVHGLAALAKQGGADNG